ncbi:MAG TPA: enoyl-CoA hydratase/isomerase family protein [Micropepsaceae bacterium]|nr:enoyl-CoA hydratase/isomerase family protein [Micropepsaceae bacterium]
METDAFRIEEDKARRIATLRLTRGATGNKLSAAEIPLVGRAIREAGSRKEIKLVLVKGDGANFCQGRLPDLPGTAPTTALAIREKITQPILDVYADIRSTPVPVIAVVQGEAKGFGCAFVSQCDLAIAADDATFSLPEMDHHLPPTLAMSAMLHKVPPKRMLHMVYTRRSIGAAEALSLGILSEVVPKGGLDAAVEAMLAHLLDRNRAALCGVKEYIGAALYADPNTAARLASNLLAAVLSSPRED